MRTPPKYEGKCVSPNGGHSEGVFFNPWPPAAALSAVGGIIVQPLLQGAKPRGWALLGACTEHRGPRRGFA
jgi:hypothetical protein